MSRLKTKRIVWTIANLVALSFVAGMVLHKPEQPKIIGDVSPTDVAEISSELSNVERSIFESKVDDELVHLELRQLLHSIRDHLRFKITSMAAYTNGHVLVGGEDGESEIPEALNLVKEGDCWVIAPRPRPTVVPLYKNVTTNIAPVSQNGIGR